MNYSKIEKEQITDTNILMNIVSECKALEEKEVVIEGLYYFSNMTKRTGEEHRYTATGIAETLEKFYHDIMYRTDIEVACIGVIARKIKSSGMEAPIYKDIIIWEEC